ncbi:MAG: tRNA uridine-5-carboxymethylaminomethyl(34) synthesis GTPase MnmE [Bacillota bacterium]
MEDTIAAIATPLGTAGIGKIRVSGPDAFEVGNRIFQYSGGKNIKQFKSHTAHHGRIIDPAKEKVIDEVVAIIFKNPHSFTGEDVIEFDCHGGKLPLQKVLEVILENGARLAEPGEFSKRAFLNGKIDLSQAESIMEVINSQTERSLDIAVNHLTGQLSDKISEIRDNVINLLAHLEASIDFPEDEIENFDSSELGQRIEEIKNDIENLLATSKQGKLYREGISTVIVGKPNVGKSSLLNYLLAEKRAIVTEIPGTTRDIIEEYINLNGIPLKIIDTAGIRPTEDVVEKIGVEKTRSSLEKADLVLMILDVSQGIEKQDLEVYNLINDKPVIILVNKTDLSRNNISEEELDEVFPEQQKIWISIKTEKGLNKLKETIEDIIFSREIDTGNEPVITRMRHQEALEESLEAINKVQESLTRDLPHDFLTIDLKNCLTSLGKITGETVNEDIVEQIFSDFCLGK